MVIAISGHLGSGKDTFANFLKKYLKPTKTTWFAYKLKQITHILTSCEFNDLFTQEGKNKYCKEFDKTLGQILQELGTDVIRDNFDQDTWVKSCLLQCTTEKHFYWYEKLVNKFKPNTFGGRDYIWLIPDLRFPNEAEAVKKLGGILIRINRENSNIQENTTRNTKHSSEIALDDYTSWNFIIKNDGTLEDFKFAAENVAYEITKSSKSAI